MNRCASLLKELSGQAALIHRPENIRWLTGFTGEGCVFLCESHCVIITDFRYVEQAQRQCPECLIEQWGRGRRPSAIVGELCDRLNLGVLRVETDMLTHDEYVQLDDALPAVALMPLEQIPQRLRTVKDADEQDSIIRACGIACQAFDNLLGKIHVGMTEKQVQILLDYEMLNLGSEGNAFNTIAAAGVNGSLPHAIPSDYEIREGDLLTLDFGAKVNGYFSDMTRTIGFGKVRPELRDLYALVLHAQRSALAAVKPGAVCGDLDGIARQILEARYPGGFGHSLGHGVGLFIHEEPRVAQGSEHVLVPGNVITIEPGVYIPGLGGCRIEDTVLITEDGMIDPVTAEKELIEL